MSIGNLENFIRPSWPAALQVKALTTLRSGGVSQNPFDNFNLGGHVGDDPAAVLENRRILKNSAKLPQEPCWISQVHGTTVLNLNDYPSLISQAKIPVQRHSSQVTLSETKIPEADVFIIPAANASIVPEADASISFKPNQVAVVLTADCLPILLCDQKGSRVAAIHAGWRGLASEIIQGTVERLDCNPKDLMAWLGPAIGPSAFEVGQDVKEAFVMEGDNKAFQSIAAKKWKADLYVLARIRLQDLGITQIYGGGFCTFTEVDRFYSFRRSNPTGRQATLIWLES